MDNIALISDRQGVMVKEDMIIYDFDDFYGFFEEMTMRNYC